MSHESQILAARTSGSSLPVPEPRVAIAVRVAVMEDLPFLDALQKRHSKALGYFPTKQFEGYIAMGGVLIAQAGSAAVGYVISRDRYLKRDELGVIYQLCVAPGEQRKLVGAALVREVFERSAYGCRLYCCWCAQDLPANRFWQSMGFLPIAFRAGSRGKRRVDHFWQRPISEGDVTPPYWFPAQTNAGAMGEDRLVLPIPPGMEWCDVMPRILPKERPALVNGTKPTGQGTQGMRAPQAPKSRGVRLGPPPSGPLADAVTVK